MKKLMSLVLIFIFIFCSVYPQSMKKSDIGYRLYKENRLDEAIKYWEEHLPKQNEKYRAAAKYLMGLSHFELAFLFFLSADIVSQMEIDYYDDLIAKNPNISEDLINFYKALAYQTSGDIKNAKKIIKSINSKKLNGNHKSHLKVLNKLCNWETASNYNPLRLGLIINQKKSFKSQNLTDYQNSKYEIFNQLNEGELDKASSMIDVIDLKSPNFIDRSIKSREIRFYDPNFFQLLTYYHLENAEIIFRDLSTSSNRKMSQNSKEKLSEILFLLNKTEKLEKLANSNPSNEKIKVFLEFLRFLKDDNRKFYHVISNVSDNEFKAKIGYYLARIKSDNSASDIIFTAFRSKPSSNIQFYLSYALSKKSNREDLKIAEGFLNDIYSRSRTTNFEENKPKVALLYSYVLFSTSPNNSCPETIGIAQLLLSHFEIFAQYHNALQGACLYYSTLGDGELVFD